MSQPKPGQYYVMPYAGPLRDRLIQAVKPSPHATEYCHQWTVRNAVTGRRVAGYVLLSSCSHISADEADKIRNETVLPCPNRRKGIACEVCGGAYVCLDSWRDKV